MSAVATDELAVRELSGVQKAALVLVNMSTERAAAVLRNFGEDEAVAIAQEMSRLRSTGGREAERAIQEFRDHAEGPQGTETGSRAIVTNLIQATYEPDRASSILERIELSEASVSFAFLDAAAPADLVAVLEHDAAATVAFVLVQLGPDTAAKVLMSLDASRRLDVAQAIATMGTPTPEAGGIVAGALRTALRRRTDAPVLDADDEGDGAGGEPGTSRAPLRVQPLVDIMNHAEPADEGELIEGLMGRDAVLAAEIRAKLLSFEDVPRLADRDLQQVLRGLDIAVLALALKGADAAIGDAVKANMSERNRTAMAEEAANLGRVPKSRVEEARNQVVRALRELAGTQGLELKKAPGEADAAPEETPAEQAEPEEEYVD